MRFIKLQLKIVFPVLLLLFMLGGQALAPASALACGSASGSPKDRVLSGVDQTGSGTDCTGTGVTNVIKAVVTVLSIIVGAAAVIMIVLSGLRYITSGGDSAKVSAAKTTLIYALVGVVIAALAQVLIHFVLFQANNAVHPSTCPTGQTGTPPHCVPKH
ncbi:MAG TPA: pilin [Candidatus Dormibacteraeota bacterium]|nr:pilin [Candidatus Dormibacteraeota bacterium]